MTELKRPRPLTSDTERTGFNLPSLSTRIGLGSAPISTRMGLGSASVRFHDCSLNDGLTNAKDLKDNAGGAALRARGVVAACLHICTLSRDDLSLGKDAKFSNGAHVSCPYLGCTFKNSQFQPQGKFPAEFLLNHLHSNHKHRRFNGDLLDLTMIVPQVEPATLKQPQQQTGLNPMTQTWPFVEIYCHKRYFYLEAQSFSVDGHAELFLWLWFLGQCDNLHFFS